MARLVVPSIRYKASYVDALNEWLLISRQPDLIVDELNHFNQWLRRIRRAERRGVFERWLVDQEEYIGSIQIRRRPSGRFENIASHIYYEIRPSKQRTGYGYQILKLGLKAARRLGLRQVLVTCDSSNVASKKIIEQNGGVLEERIASPEGEMILRYLIDST